MNKRAMISQHVGDRLTTGVIITGILVGLFFLLPSYSISMSLAVIAAYIIFFELSLLIKNTHHYALASFFYVILPFYGMISLNQAGSSRILLFILFLIVFAHDTGAYIIGKSLGKHFLCKTISPKKTWEGFFGGIIFCLLMGLIIKSRNVALWNLSSSFLLTNIMLSITIGCIATGGDLFESWLKRKSGIKDSGHLLPGHGGLLDRFDSIIPVSVFFTIFKHQLILFFEM